MSNLVKIKLEKLTQIQIKRQGQLDMSYVKLSDSVEDATEYDTNGIPKYDQLKLVDASSGDFYSNWERDECYTMKAMTGQQFIVEFPKLLLRDKFQSIDGKHYDAYFNVQEEPKGGKESDR